MNAEPNDGLFMYCLSMTNSLTDSLTVAVILYGGIMSYELHSCHAGMSQQHIQMDFLIQHIVY